LSNDDVLEHARAVLTDKPVFQPVHPFRTAMEARLAAEGR